MPSRVPRFSAAVVASAAVLPQDLDLPRTNPDLLPLLNRIAAPLERLAPPVAPPNELEASDAFVWHADRGWLEPVQQVNRVEIGLLRGTARVRDILLDNTQRFAAGLPPNTVMLRRS